MSLPAWVPIFGPLSDRRRAFRELPDLASRLGLRFVESDIRYRFGTIEGTLDGHAVEVRPDSSSVTVRFVREINGFSISMLDLGLKRRDWGLGHPKFEKTFCNVVLSPKQVEALRVRTDVMDGVLGLLRHRVVGIVGMSTGLICSTHNPYRLSSRNLPYITAPDLERL